MPTHAKQQGSPPAGDYIRMIWDRKWLILALTVCGLLLALVTRPGAPTRTYTATVPIEIRPLQFDQTGVSSSSSLTVPASEVQAAVSVDVAASTAQQLGMTDGGDSLLTNLTADGEPGAPVINLSITGDSPAISDELAAYASNYVDYRRKQDQTRVDQVLASVDTRIASLQARLDELSHELDQEQANHGSTQVTSTEYRPSAACTSSTSPSARASCSGTVWRRRTTSCSASRSALRRNRSRRGHCDSSCSRWPACCSASPWRSPSVSCDRRSSGVSRSKSSACRSSRRSPRWVARGRCDTNHCSCSVDPRGEPSRSRCSVPSCACKPRGWAITATSARSRS